MTYQYGFTTAGMIAAERRAYVEGWIDLETFERRVTPLLYPEPPRNSGEADAVHGPTALGTHHDNTPERSSTNRDPRP